MYTFIIIANLVIFLTAWPSVSASAISCDVSWNAVPLDPGKIACQAEKHYSCKVDDCWQGDPPARGDVTYNVMDHIFFKDCHLYKGDFGNSKQDKAAVRVQASRYWTLFGKTHPHANVIGHEAGKEVPKVLPGYRCYHLDGSLPQCRRESCEVVENAHW